jgi:hypothetical protein
MDFVNGRKSRAPAWIVLLTLLVAMASTSCDSLTPTATPGPCSWLTEDEVEEAIGADVSSGEYDAAADLCSYDFISRSGVSTDLVVGPGTEADLGSRRPRVTVSGLGDRAMFYRAKTLDDGNSMMIVTRDGHSLVLAGEFLTLKAAKHLAEIALTRSRS